MKSQKLSAMLLCLGEPPVRFLFLCCCSLLMCIFICRSSLFCFCIFIWFPDSFTMSPALHLGFSDPWRPPPALSFTLTTFDCLFFFIYRKRYGFEWAFFTHRCFLPYTPFRHFWHNLLLSRFPWEPALLPWCLLGFILILKAQTRPICLFDSQ